MDLRELALKVKKVRDLQKRYFKSSSKGLPDRMEILNLSREAEKELDELIDQILKGRTEQVSLFK